MNHRVSILRVLISHSVLLAGAAFAQAEHYTASLTQPISEKKEFIANGNVWRCAGTSCMLTSEPRDPGSLRTCRELKRQVGQLTAYGSAAHAFDQINREWLPGGPP
jgi:hypothetical protein